LGYYSAVKDNLVDRARKAILIGKLRDDGDV